MIIRKILFRATPAYVMNYPDEENGKCEFRQSDLNNAPSYKVDLTKNPLTVPSSSWQDREVEVDVDGSDGGCSYLYPEEGAVVAEGCLYVSDWKWKLLDLKIPDGWREYELAAYCYSVKTPAVDPEDPETVLRYHGFHAEIIAKNGSFLTCKVWSAGDSNREDASMEIKLDLANRLHCDFHLTSGEDLWPEERITPDRGEGFRGVIFIALEFARTSDLGVPKLPASLGDDQIDTIAGGKSTLTVGGSLLPPIGARLRPCDVCELLKAKREYRAKIGLSEVIAVSSQQATGALIPIQARIRKSPHYGPLFLVSDLDALYELLRWAVTCRPRRIRRCLDLVGHSTGPDNMLLLGSTEIDFANRHVSSVFKAIAEERLFNQLGIGTLRLIGCLTNRKKRAKKTLRSLARCLGVDVLGICSLVNPSEFTADGYKHDGDPPAKECGEVPFPDGPVEEFSKSKISINHASTADRAYISDDGNFLDTIATTINRHGRKVSVLMEPLAEVIVAPQGKTLKTFDILGDFEWIRECHDGSEILYRVEKRARLQGDVLKLPYYDFLRR